MLLNLKENKEKSDESIFLVIAESERSNNAHNWPGRQETRSALSSVMPEENTRAVDSNLKKKKKRVDMLSGQNEF